MAIVLLYSYYISYADLQEEVGERLVFQPPPPLPPRRTSTLASVSDLDSISSSTSLAAGSVTGSDSLTPPASAKDRVDGGGGSVSSSSGVSSAFSTMSLSSLHRSRHDLGGSSGVPPSLKHHRYPTHKIYSSALIFAIFAS